ncbi:MAG TPA: multicopper oxidase domain-containing protein, partial [Gemmatimonadaceae bacterium]|nr:multicopper oxidase domain-containing protein [Gemmatimonadaceae bacterium]
MPLPQARPLVLLVALSLPSRDGIPRSDEIAAAAPPSVVVANDNRRPAGTLKNDTLRIDLTLQTARWYPEAADGPFVDLPVFAEVGQKPQIPAPLIRVPVGTTIVASIRNTLPDSVLWVRGLTTRPAKPDSTPVKPGELRTFTFSAGAPGTYLYNATPGSIIRPAPGVPRSAEAEQLSGALIVDPRGARPNDRILVVNIWGTRIDSANYRNALAINGKSWPYTERFGLTVGDSVRWRVINGSARRHPMHLHGFYFRIDSRGTITSDSTYSGETRPLVVTEDMPPATTMSMVWSPDRPGNWLFHCHVTFHVTTGARLDGGDNEHAIHETDPAKHMAG